MTDIKYRDSHEVWWRIKRERGIKFLDGTLSLWKLKINEKDYEDLKKTLIDNRDQLQYFGTEAALCYGEWWRREYEGGIPSKEDVALGVGLSRYCAEDLYKAGRAKLDECGYVFIKSKKALNTSEPC